MAGEHDHPGLSVEVEREGPCLARVRFRVTADEMARSRQQGLRNAARRTRLKGFRPGKAPASMLEKMFGAEIDRELVEHFVRHAYEHAVNDNELRPAAQPRLDLEKVQPAAGEDWEHEFDVLLRPDFELGQVEGIEVEGRSIAVADGEVEAALTDIRRQFSRPEPAGEDGLPLEGMAVCRLEFLLPEREEPVLAKDGIRMSPKAPPFGIEEGAFQEALVGAQEGDTRELPFTFPDDFPEEEARGQTGSLRIQVTEAFRIVEPADEDLFQQFEVSDQAGLEEEVTGRIEKAKQEDENRRLENALLEKLLEAHPMELPGPLIEDQTDARVAEAKQALEEAGTAPEDLEKRLAEERARARENSTRALKAVYLMEEIARQKDLQVSNDDLQAELAAIATRNQVPLDDVRKYYQEQGLVQQLALELLERKVRSFLLQSADIRQAQEAR